MRSPIRDQDHCFFYEYIYQIGKVFLLFSCLQSLSWSTSDSEYRFINDNNKRTAIFVKTSILLLPHFKLSRKKKEKVPGGLGVCKKNNICKTQSGQDFQVYWYRGNFNPGIFGIFDDIYIKYLVFGTFGLSSVQSTNIFHIWLKKPCIVSQLYITCENVR